MKKKNNKTKQTKKNSNKTFPLTFSPLVLNTKKGPNWCNKNQTKGQHNGKEEVKLSLQMTRISTETIPKNLQKEIPRTKKWV